MGTLKMKEELLNYGTDITMLAQTGKLDPVIGREREIEDLIEALLKRRNSNACLVGDAGVGKTAIVEALAIKIAANSVPRQLRGKRVYSIEMGRLVDVSELEKRLKNMMEVVRASEGSVILFIDDLHNLINDRIGREDGIGGVATILKLALATNHNHLKCICAIRVEEYRRYIERDEALKSMFEIIQVGEPSREECFKMVEGIIHKYEKHHAVDYSPMVLVSAVDLSKHYNLREVLLPGKAINLIDRAGARAHVLGQTHVTEAEIEHVIATCGGWSTHTEAAILGLENVLKRSVIGQDEAVEAVTRSIRRAHVGIIRDETKPLGCFLFTGPTGVGKTYIAKVVARDYFGSKAAMVRLDMCQFMESNTVSWLTDLLTKAVRTRPHAVVLFEEIEKAHDKVLNVLLQILDHGRLSDSKGKTAADFTNTILIVTSNEESNKLKAEVVNRFDQVVALKALEKQHIEKILDILIDEFRAKIVATKKKQVVVSEKLKELLVRVGYDKRCGGRAIKKAFTNYVETILADAFLWKEIAKYDKVILEVNLNTGLVWWHKFIVGVDKDSDSNIISPSDKMRWRLPSEIYIPLS